MSLHPDDGLRVSSLTPVDGGRPDLLRRAARIRQRYQNPVPTGIGGLSTALRVLPRYLSSTVERVPKRQLGPFRTDPAIFGNQPASGLRVTWMGHSTLLLELDGLRVLIDPVWEERASPFKHFGPRRFFPPTLALEQLPPLDVILVSHNHYDHLGVHTLAKLARLPQTGAACWITSLGVGALLRRCGVNPQRLSELDWTEGVRVTPSTRPSSWLEIRAWPARHFSGRGLRDRFDTLWSSFSLRGPAHSVFFGGDSGPWEGFAPIAQICNGFDLTMLEIGAYDELWADIHLGPDAAIEAFRAMHASSGRAGLFMPIHWGLFDLALHAWDQPIERAVELCRRLDVGLWDTGAWATHRVRQWPAGLFFLVAGSPPLKSRTHLPAYEAVAHERRDSMESNPLVNLPETRYKGAVEGFLGCFMRKAK